MARAIPAVDVSVTWAPCTSCPYRHSSHAPCPPGGTWLVLHFCPACDERTQLYCRTHRDRHVPALSVVPPLPDLDIQQRRAGDEP